MWVTGTVPLGDDPAGHAAWTRYESLVNEVLAPYAFPRLVHLRHARAAGVDHRRHEGSPPRAELGTGDRSRSSAEYLEPAAFLTDPLAGVPDPTAAPPSVRRRSTDSRT